MLSGPLTGGSLLPGYHTENYQSSSSKEVVLKTLPACPVRPTKPQLKGKIHVTAFKINWDQPIDTSGAEIQLNHLEISSGATKSTQTPRNRKMSRTMRRKKRAFPVPRSLPTPVATSCSSRTSIRWCV